MEILSVSFCAPRSIIGKTGKISYINTNGNPSMAIGQSNWSLKPTDIRLSAPTFTGTYEERQKQWIGHHGLKVGSKVRVVKKFTYEEDGCDVGCNKDKENCIGKVFNISDIDPCSIQLNNRTPLSSWFPYFVLEPVK